MRIITNIAKLDKDGKVVLDEFGTPVMEVFSEVEVESQPEPPDWLGLEKELRGSKLYEKALTIAKESLPVSVGINLFMITLSNGKRGDASVNALKFAFDNLPIEWDGVEISELNEYLSKYNFNIVLK